MRDHQRMGFDLPSGSRSVFFRAIVLPARQREIAAAPNGEPEENGKRTVVKGESPPRGACRAGGPAGAGARGAPLRPITDLR